MTRTLFIRADASRTMGSGHVVRCSSMGEALRRRGWDVVLGGYGETAAIARDKPGFDRIVDLPRVDAPAPNDLRYDAALVDHYGLDAEYETALSREGRVPVAVIDDIRNRAHAADILIDPTPGAPRQPAARNLIGPSAAPLRAEFAQNRAAAIAGRILRRPGRRIFLSFGAFDPAGATVRALAPLQDADAEIHVVMSAQAPTAEAVQDLARNHVRLHFDPSVQTIIRLMCECDVSIGAGGSTSWERCCLGLPTVVTVLADNQQAIADALQRSGAAHRADEPAEAADRALALLDDIPELRKTSELSAGLCDGLGAERIADALCGALQVAAA